MSYNVIGKQDFQENLHGKIDWNSFLLIHEYYNLKTKLMRSLKKKFKEIENDKYKWKYKLFKCYAKNGLGADELHVGYRHPRDDHIEHWESHDYKYENGKYAPYTIFKSSCLVEDDYLYERIFGSRNGQRYIIYKWDGTITYDKIDRKFTMAEAFIKLLEHI